MMFKKFTALLQEQYNPNCITLKLAQSILVLMETLQFRSQLLYWCKVYWRLGFFLEFPFDAQT